MNTTAHLPGQKSEESLRADLAAATFRVAKRHGFHAALIDIELDVWDARREQRDDFSAAPLLHATAAPTTLDRAIA